MEDYGHLSNAISERISYFDPCFIVLQYLCSQFFFSRQSRRNDFLTLVVDTLIGVNIEEAGNDRLGRRVQEFELVEDRHYFEDSVCQWLYLHIVDEILSDYNDIAVIVLVALVDHLHVEANDCLRVGSQHQDYRISQVLGVP